MNHATIKRSLVGVLLGVLSLPLQAQVPVLQVQTQGGAGLSASTQTDLVFQVQLLQDEIRQLRGEVEALEHKLRRFENTTEQRYLALDRSVSAMMDVVYGTDAPVTAPEPPAASASTETPTSEPEVAPAAQSGNDQTAYDAAFALVRERQFAAAITAFEAFVREHPNTSNTANGYYWLGELHLAQKSPEKARDAFNTVLERFPTHHKVADTLYKLGVTYADLGEHERSRHMLDRVINEFPQSTAAALAKNFRPTANP